MTCSIDCQSFSPVIPNTVQWARKKSGMVAEMGVMHGFNNMDFQSPRLTWLQIPVECQICQQQRPTLSPRYGTIPQGDQLATWWHNVYTGYFLCGKDKALKRYSGYGVPFLANNALAKTTIHGLIECLMHQHGIPHSIASDQRTHFTARDKQQWAHDHGIY